MQPSSVPTTPDPIEPVPEETLESIALRLDSLVQAFEQHPNEAVRQQVLEMLGRLPRDEASRSRVREGLP